MLHAWGSKSSRHAAARSRRDGRALLQARSADDGARVASNRDRDAARSSESTGLEVPTEQESPEQESTEQESTELETTEQGSTELEATEVDERESRDWSDTGVDGTGSRRTGAGGTGALGDDASMAPNRDTKFARPHISTPELVSSEESRV